jgi:glycosyltransferase involved in cell wall biosynthesis
MRIAHVTDCYLPRLGGIEMQVRDLAAHQRAAGHDVEVLTSTAVASVPRRPSRAEDLGVTVRRLDALIGDLPSATGLAHLRAAIAGGGYDVVHAHTSTVSPLAWSAMQAAVRSRVPAAVTLHSMLSPRARLLAASAATTGWSRWPVAWTAVSTAAAGPLRAVLGPEAVNVLPNGIDHRFWRLDVPRHAGAVLTIASVMRLSRRKRPRSLVRILAEIRTAVPAHVPLRAVIVGDGPQRPALERALRTGGLDSWVTLTGALERIKVRDVLAGSDIYLAPAHRESFGIAALEARCAGLAVIAMAAGGVRDFVRDGEEGLLVASDREMAQVTARLLMSSRLRVMQEHNRVSDPRLSWPVVVDRSLDVYDRAVGVAARVRGARARQPVAR